MAARSRFTVLKSAPYQSFQAVRQANDLALRVCSSQRNGVDVVADDLLAGAESVIGPALVCAERAEAICRNLSAADSVTAFGGVARFFQLRSQRASADYTELVVDRVHCEVECRLTEATPLHGRIAIRVFTVENLTILNEKKRVDDDGRNRLEVGIRFARV